MKQGELWNNVERSKEFGDVQVELQILAAIRS